MTETQIITLSLKKSHMKLANFLIWFFFLQQKWGLGAGFQLKVMQNDDEPLEEYEWIAEESSDQWTTAVSGKYCLSSTHTSSHTANFQKQSLPT